MQMMQHSNCGSEVRKWLSFHALQLINDKGNCIEYVKCTYSDIRGAQVKMFHSLPCKNVCLLVYNLP